MPTVGHTIRQINQDGFPLLFWEVGNLTCHCYQYPFLVHLLDHRVQYMRLFLHTPHCYSTIILLRKMKQLTIAAPQIPTVVLCDSRRHVFQRINGRCLTAFSFSGAFDYPQRGFLDDIFYYILFLAVPKRDVKRIDQVAGEYPERWVKLIPGSLTVQINALRCQSRRSTNQFTHLIAPLLDRTDF